MCINFPVNFQARDLLLLWHSRPGGQNNRGGQWEVPEWWEGALPEPLQTRSDDFESDGTRIPGGMLKPEGGFGVGSSDPRQIDLAGGSSSKL